MNACWTLALLLAEIGDNFPDSGKRLQWHDLWAYGLIAVAAGIVAGLVAHIRNRNDMTQRCNHPWKLFRELCQVHNLDRSSQRLLAKIAKARRLEQPAQLFLTPGAFEPAGLPPQLRDRGEHVLRLRSQLF